MPPRKFSAAARPSQQTTEQFAELLKKGDTPPVIFLYGDDSYLRERTRDLIVEHSVPEASREWAVVRLAARENGLEDTLRLAEMRPMLAARQVVIVQDLEHWQRSSSAKASVRDNDEEDESTGDTGPASTGETLASEEFLRYLKNPAPFTVLVLEAAKLDERTRLFKLLSENAVVVGTSVSSSKDPEERRAAAVEACRREIQVVAAQLGVKMDAGATVALAEATNGSLALMHSEMEKLALYVGEKGLIHEQDVEAIVPSAREYSVWQFAGMMAQRERQRALTFLESLLREGQPPPAIVGAMAWMMRKLIEVQELPPGMDSWRVSSELRLRRDTAEMAQREARRIPRARLLDGLTALYEADSRLKSGARDKRAVLEALVIRLTA